jgi:hypothetical protein
MLLPAHPDLAGANMELPREAGSETRLREALAGVRERFAFVILDCPPSLGPLTVNALVAADRVIVPVQTEYFALEGLAGLLDTLALVQRELNPRLTVAGMLLTMHDARTRLARAAEEDVRKHFPGARLRHRDPAERADRRVAVVRTSRHPPRPALGGRGRVLRARAGGGRSWLTCARHGSALHNPGRWTLMARPTGMGRGLGAILAVSSEEARERDELRELAVELISPNPRQPRRPSTRTRCRRWRTRSASRASCSP